MSLPHSVITCASSWRQAGLDLFLSKLITHCTPQCRFVWGRGAQDVKVTVTQLLEAATLLLEEGCADVSVSDHTAGYTCLFMTM